jgi:hypothetical protein
MLLANSQEGSVNNVTVKFELRRERALWLAAHRAHRYVQRQATAESRMTWSLSNTQVRASSYTNQSSHEGLICKPTPLHTSCSRIFASRAAPCPSLVRYCGLLDRHAHNSSTRLQIWTCVLLQAELKEGCRQAGLAISGTKAKLLARLQQNGVANSYGASDASGSSNKKQKTEEDQSVSTDDLAAPW